MEPVRNQKLAESIAEHLEQLILEGALRPGERLASERELAEKFEVSRPCLREAIESLQKRGLLETTRAGTIVAEFMAPLTEPLVAILQSNEKALLDYLEYRGLIEGEAARLAALRATEHEIEAIRACLERMKAAHQLDDPTAEAGADADLHVLIYEASHNIVLLHIMRAFSDMLRRGVFYNRNQLYAHKGFRDQLLAQHLAIGEAIVARKPEEAAAAASYHMRSTGETLKKIREDDARVARVLRRMGRGELLARQSG
ncbi:FCD domain-containing protein [Rhodoblastus acidophilus]|uniref:Pyruvate dehydrogenase complex repressor n=1 Tax=Candidatus Rhodoblastus alkanivorans TaxID=2954117 RepID=A0ABS9Z521_9HYPH|nr:FCD domain-containing protein [Candidatus Rhodoblastus alkanivorans]MCI4679869.1 FCD domain-containing protein [Candidatus Rhodoblastus alkanivorans]MCI4682728.1 FCD domain-containing protein [Candidatus Rhodoblastus alkanivorans]MDI4640035.1 FCD domain-containing protein [Rhodoblastus acidophilus]